MGKSIASGKAQKIEKSRGNTVVRHIVIGLLSGIILIGGPIYAAYGPSGTLLPDAVSAATVIIEQPSGAYVVLINRDRRKSAENLETWKSFFKGEEIGFLFEDISCMVPSSDQAGLELAKSFQSRLPENQMKLRTEETTLLFSKAQYGEFDVIVLSKEAADAYDASMVAAQPFVEIVESEGSAAPAAGAEAGEGAAPAAGAEAGGGGQ